MKKIKFTSYEEIPADDVAFVLDMADARNISSVSLDEINRYINRRPPVDEVDDIMKYDVPDEEEGYEDPYCEDLMLSIGNQFAELLHDCCMEYDVPDEDE